MKLYLIDYTDPETGDEYDQVIEAPDARAAVVIWRKWMDGGPVETDGIRTEDVYTWLLPLMLSGKPDMRRWEPDFEWRNEAPKWVRDL